MQILDYQIVVDGKSVGVLFTSVDQLYGLVESDSDGGLRLAAGAELRLAESFEAEGGQE